MAFENSHDSLFLWVERLKVPALGALLIVSALILFIVIRRHYSRIRQLESDAARLRDRLRMIISSAGIGVWEWDIVRNRGIWDESMYRLYGAKPGELELDAESWKQMVYEPDRERTLAELENAVLNHTHFDVSFRIVTKSQQIESIRSVGEVLRDASGAPIGVQGASWSISRELDLVAESERQKRFTEDILDSIADPVFMKDRNHRWIYGNRAFSDLLGKTKDEYLGKSDFDYFPPDLARLYWAGDELTLSELRAKEFEEESYRGESLRTILTKKSPVKLPSGELGVIGIIRDITERRQMEKQLDDQRARQIAASRLASLGEMAGGMAHEINNPLAIISAYATRLSELLENLDEAGLGAEQSQIKKRSIEIAGKIESTAHRISTIVKGLRTIARDGNRDEVESVAVGQLIDETLSLCHETMKTNGVTLETHFAGASEMCEVRVRRVQLSQVLLNLLNNSVYAVSGQPNGRIHIGVRTLKRGPDTCEVEISVSDNGPGVPEEIREKIFEPFFTTKPVGQGTGLGLSIAASVMREHGGQLTLERSQFAGFGTCFSVRLPARAVEES